MGDFAVLSKWEAAALSKDSVNKVLELPLVYLVQVGFVFEAENCEDDTFDALKGYSGTIIKDRSKVSEVLLQYEISKCPCIVKVDNGKITYEELQTENGASKVGGISKSEGEVKILVDRGVEAFDNMNLQLAACLFAEAYRWDSHKTSALFNLASICQMSNYPTLAVAYFQAVLEEHPEDMTALKSLWNLAQTPDGEGSNTEGSNGYVIVALEPIRHWLTNLTIPQRSRNWRL